MLDRIRALLTGRTPSGAEPPRPRWHTGGQFSGTPAQDRAQRIAVIRKNPMIPKSFRDRLPETEVGPPRTHDLKIWPIYFDAVAFGDKRFEVRKDDRDFRVGDELRLREWDPQTESYTGRECLAVIDYLLTGGALGIETGYVVMSITPGLREL